MPNARARTAWRQVASATTDAYLTMTSRPGRTIAMIAGILLGVASATTAVLIADTQQAQIDLRFDAQRSGHVMLQAQIPTGDGFDPQATETIGALDPVTTAGELSIWRESTPVSVNAHAPTDNFPLVGATAEGLTAAGTASTYGLGHASIDHTAGTPVVWLGVSLAERLGISSSTPQTARVAGRSYTVAGLIHNDDGFGYLNSAVVMSPQLASRRLSEAESVRFLARVRPGSAAAVSRYALAALDPTREQRLADVTQPDGEILQNNVAHDMRRVGIGLGLFVGLVGMVAVANTLGMAVNQRTRELGLRSALGWDRRRIGSLILLESAVAGLAAALMGCGLGFVAAFAWTVSQGWGLIINPWLAPMAVAAGTLFSVIGGIIPANRAASISPLTAMRQ